MEEKIDFTLYNKIKAHFSVEKGKVIFISLTSDKVEELFAEASDRSSIEAHFRRINEHCDNMKPYAVFSDLYEDGEAIFFFACKEFLQEESIPSGKILEFERNPFKHAVIDMDRVRKNLAELGRLLRNTEAS